MQKPIYDTIPTVNIKSTHPSQGAFVVINADDFDEAKGHELYEAVKAEPEKQTLSLRRSRPQQETQE